MASAICTEPPWVSDPFDDVYALQVDSDSILKFNERKGLESRREHEFGNEHIPSNVVGLSTFASAPANNNLPSMLNLESFENASRQTIEWSDQDLCYLVWARFGKKVAQDNFPFKPRDPVESTTTDRIMLQIRVYEPTPTAYSVPAPIGTGRPEPKILATSRPSATLAQARRTIAADLLSCSTTIRYTIRWNTLLSDLYALSETELASIRCAMMLMWHVSDKEWVERRIQLQRALYSQGDPAVFTVNSCWSVQTRLELFLLESGCYEVGKWFEAVDGASRMREAERRELANDFGTLARWLERISKEYQG
ncbi:hypothetical protein DM02DRAFT_672524 [Periconia macrospinosa]|uniref:Uncharacterized protein n=1 Tax=Periconia macrospinosa TaxID=97972 RepID=A0A2V1DN42_9PLEO|nr:hypothetical protein DM02DRAFT_672524 [Periconia macrospinosa]